MAFGLSAYADHVDLVLLSERRNAEAALSESATLENFFQRMQISIGLPNEAGSLTDRLTQLESALTEATLAPENDALLNNVVEDLKDLTAHLNGLGNAVQDERTRADAQIATEVATLNRDLLKIEELTDSIQKHMVLNHDVSAMLDQRQQLIDDVNEIVPVAELDRGHGNIALMTSGGLLLFDGTAADLEFTNTPFVGASMSLETDTLSGLGLSGRDIPLTRSPSPIGGGRLAALFHIRDVDATQAQGQLDAYARDLIERFEHLDVDVTRAPTDPGLLTDGGVLFDQENELGLSQRLSVNGLIDPEQGGEVWRLRDGLGTTAPLPGGEGNASLILRLSDALAKYQTPSSDAFSEAKRTAATLASDLMSQVGAGLEAVKQHNVFAQAQFDTLKEMELANGVDTDAELQKLLLIEQAYAANARVIQVADEMLDWLMRI